MNHIIHWIQRAILLYLGKVWTFRRFVWCHYVNLSPKVPLGIRQKRQDAITVLPHKQALIIKLFILISKCISAFFFLLTWSHCLLLQFTEKAKSRRNSLEVSAAYRFFSSAQIQKTKQVRPQCLKSNKKNCWQNITNDTHRPHKYLTWTLHRPRLMITFTLALYVENYFI